MTGPSEGDAKCEEREDDGVAGAGEDVGWGGGGGEGGLVQEGRVIDVEGDVEEGGSEGDFGRGDGEEGGGEAVEKEDGVEDVEGYAERC